MSGIICWACLILAISVLQFALLQWQSEFNKNQEKNESQQNRNLWWIWQRGCQRSCRLRLHQAQGWHGTNIKILGNLLRETIDQGNLRDRHHQVIQKRIMVKLGLLKSGKVELRRTIDRGNLRKLLGIWCNKLPVIVKNLFSTEMRIPQGTKRRFTMDRGNLRNRITKKRQIPKLSSWEVTQQNLWTK